MRVIAGRERDDAGGALVGVKLQQAIQRTANLEAARVLQALGLEQDARAGAAVDGFGLEHRRLDEPAAQARLRIDDVGDRGQDVAHRMAHARG